MKKLTAALLCLCVTLCGCNNKPITDIQIAHTVAGENVIIETPDTMYLGDTVYAMVTCPVSSSAVDDQGQVIFTQSYQKFRFYLDNNDAQQTMEQDLQTRLNRFFANAGTIQAQAQQDCFSTEDWIPYYAKIRYTPTRIDEDVISLMAVHETYNGNATAQSISCVTYDTATGAVLYLGDILEPTCTGSVLAQRVIEELEGTEGLYAEYADSVYDIFSGSISGYSNWYFDQEGLCVQFSPYEIGPSDVRVRIGYDALGGMVKDLYLIGPDTAQGSLAAEIWPEDAEERFSFMAQAELDPKGSKIVIYPNETVNGLRVEAGTLEEDGAVFTPTATVFAADSFYLGNALVLTTQLTGEAPTLRVSYRSGGQSVSAYVLYHAEENEILLAYG